MSWKCPQCNESNADDINRCTCGYLLPKGEGNSEPAGAVDSSKTRSVSVPFELQPHPWIRYWARTFDLNLFSLAIGFVVFFTTGKFIGSAMAQVTISYLSLGCFFAAFIVESILIAWIGTTPGKYLLEINVRKPDHSLLPFSLSLNRSLSIWMKAYALGFPLISFLTVAYAGNCIQKYGKASWDAEYNIMVFHKSLNQTKIFLFIVLFIGVITIWVLLSTPQVPHVTPVATLQDAEGYTEADFDLASLKRIEKMVVEASVKGARETYASTGNDVSKFNPHVVSDAQFVNFQEKKLGIIRIAMYASDSDQKSSVRITRIMGFTRRGMETVGCIRYGDKDIPVFTGVCGDKIRAIFGAPVSFPVK